MNKFKKIILILSISIGLGLTFIPVGVNAATNVFTDCTDPSLSNTTVCKGRNDSFGSFLHILVNSLLFILGAIAVLVIIYGGIIYSMSAGDPALVTKAKNTIIYAVIGLVVAIGAYAIVNFVIRQF